MMSPRLHRFLFPALIVVVICAWFSPWWIGGKVLAPLDLQNLMMSPWRGANESEFAKNHIVSDGVDQYLVYRLIAERDYRREGHVGWSSLTYGGTAQYANTMALYYDWTMQLHRWFDFWTAWHLGLMGQVVLAAFGMFLFLRGRNVRNIWAICGALAYAANSQFVTWIYHRWALGSFCWVPWILWSIDLYRREPRRAWALVPLFIAMAFLGGTLQHTALVILAVLAMWAEEAISQNLKFKIQNSTSRTSARLRLLSRYAIWGLLGSGLAAMMLLPCTDAFITSNRLGLHTGMTANTENSIFPKGSLQPLFNLAAYPFQIFPSILGRCGSVDVIKLFKSELFYIVYFGSMPVLIAYLAFWRRDSPPLARILIGMGLLLPLTPLVRLLYQRLFLLFIIGGILAFVHFMQTATRETRLRLFRISGILLLFGIATWTGLSLFMLAKPGIPSSIRDKIASDGYGSSFGHFRDWIGQRADHFVGDLMIWSPQQAIPLALLVIALVGLRWGASMNGNRQMTGQVVVLLAVLCEVSLFGARWIVWSDPKIHPFFAETAESRILAEKTGRDGRVTTLIHPSAHMAKTPFVPNTLSVYEVATITGYDSIVPDGMILPNETPGDANRLGRLGVSHLITWHGNQDIPQGWELLWQSVSMDLYQNSNRMPRYAGFRTSEQMDAFFSGNDSKGIDLIEVHGKENTRLLELPEGVRWIRIAENHAEGWEYRPVAKDAAWKPVIRAADASMLLENPRLDRFSRIEMRYDPLLRKIGFVVSGSSLLILGVGQWLIMRRSCHIQAAS